MSLPPPKKDPFPSSAPAQDALPMAIVAEEVFTARAADRAGQIAETIAEKKPKNLHKYRKAKPKSKESQAQPSFKYKSKGITYITPVKAYLGAVITAVFIISSLLTMFIPLYLYIMQTINLISLIIPAVAVISGILYLSVALQCKCRVCRTPVYSFKNFLRHKKAHHLPIFGHTFAVALHVILFLWFRCQSCGTSQKLVKGRSER